MHDRSHDLTETRARVQPAEPATSAPVRRAVEPPLLQLQRTHGNRFVQRLVAAGADGGEVSADLEQRIDRARGSGSPLDSGVRGGMEAAFGADFGGVCVHTGAEAHSLNRAVSARAFTTGSDVFFASGEYAPGTSAGQELIAHELTHVVQQTGGVQAKLAVGASDDLYEREADTIARTVVRGESAAATGRVDRAGIQRQATSNPPDMDEKLKQQGLLQRKPMPAAAVRGRVSRSLVQRRGGPTTGTLSVASNVVSAGLTAGHAWLVWQPALGATRTYGTWGNKTPIGLYYDQELAYPIAAGRTTNCDATDKASLDSFATANNAWSLTNNCASFAARGWMTVAGEALAYTTAFIPNPSALGAGIVAANGGTAGTLAVGPGGGSSSGPTSSAERPSSASSAAGSSSL
jgi:hypothetical protein